MTETTLIELQGTVDVRLLKQQKLALVRVLDKGVIQYVHDSTLLNGLLNLVDAVQDALEKEDAR